MDHDSSAGMGILAGVFFIEFIVIVAVIAFTIWAYWRIFAKAGYNGAMALLNLIPGFGNLICICILAFGRWPIEDRLAGVQGGTPPPSPGPAPGSSVMPTA